MRGVQRRRSVRAEKTVFSWRHVVEVLRKYRHKYPKNSTFGQNIVEKGERLFAPQQKSLASKLAAESEAAHNEKRTALSDDPFRAEI